MSLDIQKNVFIIALKATYHILSIIHIFIYPIMPSIENVIQSDLPFLSGGGPKKGKKFEIPPSEPTVDI